MNKTILRSGPGPRAPSSGVRPGRPMPTARPAPSRPSSRPGYGSSSSSSRHPATSESGNSAVWIVAGVVSVLIIFIVLIAASGRHEPQSSSTRKVARRPAQVVQPEDTSDVGKPDPRLGGKTWAEWSKEQEKNSELLQNRKKGIRGPTGP